MLDGVLLSEPEKEAAMLRRCTTVTIVLLLVCMAVAYGCQKSPEDARKELGALGVPYTHAAFLQAAQNNDKLAMELFLAAGMNPNRHHKDRGTALMSAAFQGHTESIQALLAAGANPDLATKDGWTALKWAAFKGHTESVRVLREAVAEGK